MDLSIVIYLFYDDRRMRWILGRKTNRGLLLRVGRDENISKFGSRKMTLVIMNYRKYIGTCAF
jgi:hypothetical protein